MTTDAPHGIWAWAEAEPNRPALIDASGNVTSMAELLAIVNRMSHLLRGVGMGVGDNVAVILPNGIEFFAVYLAALQCGFYFTPLNYHLTADEVNYVLVDCEAEVFIAHERFGQVALDASTAAGIAAGHRFAVGSIDGFGSLDTALAGQPDTSPGDLTVGERLIYTSGTSGRPKGIKRPLPGVSPAIAFAERPAAITVFGTDDPTGVHLLAGPCYHSAPNSISASALHAGQTVVMMDEWSSELALELIDRHGVTNSHMVPTMFHRLLRVDDDIKSAFDGSSLVRVAHGAAPVSKEQKLRMIEWWGPIIYEYFGSTEVSGTGVDSEEWLAHPGTVGKPWPGVTLKILDDDGNECPAGVPGRVFMRSQQSTFEYFKAPEKTDAGIVDGLITVGDIGYVDEEGRLYPCDRESNMIISGGVNIYPAEVENVLLEHPAVADVAVFGVPNEEWGEEVKAVVEVGEGYEETAALATELIEFSRSNLAHLKCPRTVDFRAELPRGANGKSYKRLLRAEYWADSERKI